MAVTYSECCPPNPIQIGPKGDAGPIGPAGPITTAQLITVGGVVGMEICGVALTRTPLGILSWSPDGTHGIDCQAGKIAVKVNPGSPVPMQVTAAGVEVGPVDMLSLSAVTNFCPAVAQCASGGLTNAGALLTAGPGLIAAGTQLTVGDDPSSIVPYTVTTSGLNIGPVPAAAVSGLCAATLACVVANPAPYAAAIITGPNLCAAGVVTTVADTGTITLTKSAGCQLTADLKINPASPLPVSSTGAGLTVGLPTQAQLCSVGVLTGATDSATIDFSVTACNLTASVIIPALVSADSGQALTVGSDGKLLITCAAVRPCFSGAGVISYTPGTGVFAVAPGVDGQVLLTSGGVAQWGALPAGTTVAAGNTGVTVTGGPAYVVSFNRPAVVGAGLMAGSGAVDIALDTASATFTNGVCTYLGSVAANGTATAATRLIGTDCKSYTLPANLPITAAAGSGITASGTDNHTLTINRADLIAATTGSSLEAGSGTVGIQVKVDGTTVTRSATGALQVSPCEVLKVGAAGAGTAALATDKFMVLDAAGNCQVRVLPAAGLSPSSGVATTVTGTGAVDVDVDGTTIKVTADALTVDPCEVAKKGAAAAGTVSATGDKVLAVDSAGNCVVRNLVPTVPASSTVQGTMAYVKDCATGNPVWGNIAERMALRTSNAASSLVPASDRVVVMDTAAGNLVFTLAAPGACDPVDFHIKKGSAANTLTVNPQAGATIDGLASLVIGSGTTGFGANPSLHVMWTGTTWIVL